MQDLHGKANVYFQYSCILVDLVSHLRKLKLNMGDAAEIKKEATEKIRSHLVNGMRGNQQICIYTGEEPCDLAWFADEKELPLQMLLDYEWGHIHDNYVGIVHEDEKFDNITREVDGHFFAGDKFSIAILTELTNPDDIKTMLHNMPHDKLQKFVVEP